MNSTKEYKKKKTVEPSPVRTLKTGSKYPLLTGLLIGAVGGAAGTLLYDAFHNTTLWANMSFLSDNVVKVINLTYKLPVYVVAALVAGGAVASYYYFQGRRNS